ncbi:TPA: type II toxin-antitoxin system HicA family toxin [Candidatus Nomurabacteria bacterium]|nr:type II toxin-antitoxin system HicA family toxin [Candidatus Nomurabacteria bacterium]
MPKLPKAREIEKVLKSLGYVLSRQSGSHAIFKNTEGKRIVIPIHGGKEISIGVFLAILSDLNMTKEEFWEKK